MRNFLSRSPGLSLCGSEVLGRKQRAQGGLRASLCAQHHRTAGTQPPSLGFFLGFSPLGQPGINQGCRRDGDVPGTAKPLQEGGKPQPKLFGRIPEIPQPDRTDPEVPSPSHRWPGGRAGTAKSNLGCPTAHTQPSECPNSGAAIPGVSPRCPQRPPLSKPSSQHAARRKSLLGVPGHHPQQNLGAGGTRAPLL